MRILCTVRNQIQNIAQISGWAMIISSKLICLYRKYRVQNQAYEHLSSLLAAIKYMIKHNDSFLLFCLFLREIRTIQEQLYY